MSSTRHVNIAAHLPEMADLQPEVAAIHCPVGSDRNGLTEYVTWSFRQLDQESDRIALGLKAIGILLICFGSGFELTGVKGKILVPNLLNVKEIGDEEEILTYAYHLVNLQHYRNPYIHPEISEMEKVSLLRDTAIKCLRYIMRLSN